MGVDIPVDSKELHSIESESSKLVHAHPDSYENERSVIKLQIIVIQVEYCQEKGGQDAVKNIMPLMQA